jgi:hypothetical protein
MKQFQLAVCGTMNPQRRLQKLQACFKNHFSLTDSKDHLLIENYIKLLGEYSELSFVSHLSLITDVILRISRACQLLDLI